MRIIIRKLETLENEDYEVTYFGFNSNNVFTICLENDVIINLDGKEFYKLKSFVEKIR